METNHNLSSGLEDYIETIYISELNKFPLKGAELARKLNISRASVSEALSRLVEKGLINYKKYGFISLTPLGKKEAERVFEKHNILKTFFEKVLDIPSEEAAENACKIEHIVSDNVIKSIQKFTSTYRKNK